MRAKRHGNDLVILAHTTSNQSRGVFLVFLGLIASWPTLYMFDLWFTHAPRSLYDWAPAGLAATLLTIAGFYLIVGSTKRICVNDERIGVKDGPLHPVLTFQWQGEKFVRLQSIISERDDRPQTTWIVKLVNDRHEYTLDERLGQQIESRGIAEAIAKTLGCPLMEKNEDGQDLAIEARDLDMPFSERVKRYPNLLGRPIAQPANAGVVRSDRNGGVQFSWGIVTGGLLAGMIGVGLLFFIVSAVPPQADHPSYFAIARANGDYRIYYGVISVIMLALFVISGFRVRVTLDVTEIDMAETLWGVEIAHCSIPNCEVEEVQVSQTVRGSKVQVVSDNALMQFRTGDMQVAGWLAYEIRTHLAGPGACKEPGIGDRGSGDPRRGK